MIAVDGLSVELTPQTEPLPRRGGPKGSKNQPSQLHATRVDRGLIGWGADEEAEVSAIQGEDYIYLLPQREITWIVRWEVEFLLRRRKEEKGEKPKHTRCPARPIRPFSFHPLPLRAFSSGSSRPQSFDCPRAF